jgi:hypothetical protein
MELFGLGRLGHRMTRRCCGRLRRSRHKVTR